MCVSSGLITGKYYIYLFNLSQIMQNKKQSRRCYPAALNGVNFDERAKVGADE